MEKFSEKEIKGFLARALRYARKIGCGDDTEDIAQDVVSSWTTKGRNGQTLEHAVIDALRVRSGKKSDVNYDLRRAIGFRECQDGTSALENHKAVIPDADLAIDFERIADMLDREDRIAWILIYAWGFSQAEIAKIFGITQASISYKMIDIEKKVKKFVKRKRIKFNLRQSKD